MKQSRQLKIIRYLLKSNQYQTIQEIADTIGVSNRTIRHDLDSIEFILTDYKLSLIKKTGSGILIQGDPQAKLVFESQFKYQSESTQTLSPKERHIYIALRILSNESTRILDLVEALYVSRATIQKDLNEIKVLCALFDIHLERQGTQGLYIIGKERKIRNFMFDLMTRCDSFSTFESFVHNPSKSCTGQLIFPGLDLTDDEIVAGINPLLNQYDTYLSKFPLNALSQCLVRVIIVCIRSNLGFSANLSSTFVQELKEFPEAYKTSLFLLNKQAFGKPLDSSNIDIYYLQIYVVAYQQSSMLPTENDDRIKSFVNDLLSYWSEHSSVDLMNDLQLIRELEAHMNAVDIRLNYGIPIKNPLMSDIKTYYSNTHTLIQKSLKSLEDTSWHHLSEDEVGYITLYLAGALERHKHQLRTLLVTDAGRSAQSILVQKIKFNLTEIDLLKVISQAEYTASNFEDYDLILTTMQINTLEKAPTIQINSLLKDEDLIRLKRTITPLFKRKNSPKREPN